MAGSNEGARFEPPERPTGLKKSIFLSSGKMFVYQGLVVALGFVLQALIARSCGPEALGGFTLFVAWLSILTVLTFPGVEGTLVFFLPRFETNLSGSRRVVRTTLGLTLGISALVSGWLLIAGGRPMAAVGLPPVARVPFAFGVFLFSIGRFFESVLLGMREGAFIGYYNFIRTVLRVLLCLPLLVLPGHTWAILFGAVTLECGITTAMKFHRVARKFHGLLIGAEAGTPNPDIDGRRIAAVLVPMFGIGIIDTLSPFMDKAILGGLLPLALLGIYRVAESLASMNTVFVSPFMVFWPYISKLYNENRIDELQDAYRNITLLIVTLMVPLMLILLDGSRYILGWFGPQIAASGNTIFLVLVFGSFVDALAGPAGAVLKMTKHPRLSFFINMLLLVVYVGLSMVLIRRYGLIGAAVAKTATLVLGNLVNVSANRFLVGLFPYNWNHLLLLGAGAVAFGLRSLLAGNCAVLKVRIAALCMELILFTGVALVLLRKPLRKVLAALPLARPGGTAL